MDADSWPTGSAQLAAKRIAAQPIIARPQADPAALASRVMSTPAPEATRPAAPSRGFWLAWGGFCTLMVLVALQEGLFDGRRHWQWPLFDELLCA